MGRPAFAPLRSQDGFTIIEAMVACVVLLAGIMTVATLIDSSNQTTVRTRTRVIATNVAREVVEAARGVSYNEISDATIAQEIQTSEPGLADDEPGNPFTVKRRGVVFTIVTDTCIMDDRRDGGGAAPRTGDYCPDSVGAGTPDPRSGQTDRIPEDYKRVKVTIQWKQGGQSRESTQTTFVNNPGSAGAPAVLTLSSTNLGDPPRQIRPGESQVMLVATTSSQPYTLRWLLDGSVHQTVCVGCAGKSFTFRWDISPNAGDGPYLITGEATDKAGVAGQSRSMTVFLNRDTPIAPQGFAGGHQPNGTVELEWLPNPERDLRGYAVYRQDSTGTRLVCAMQVATSCVDADPPSDATIVYRIHAYDSDYNGTTPRQSPRFTDINVLRDNRPPHPPTDASVLQVGSDTRLTWKAADPDDPDTGDEIAFYRIYRDGTAISNRYARGITDANGIGSFVDRTNGASHTYYIAAVDSQLRESDKVGPLR